MLRAQRARAAIKIKLSHLSGTVGKGCKFLPGQVRVVKVALGIICLLAPAQLPGQRETPHIGIIDFYGLRKIPEGRVREALGVKVGDPFPSSKSELERHIERTVPGIARARLQGVCCDAGKAILYIGIEEQSAPVFDFRPPPESDAALPQKIVETYERFLVALEEAVRNGDASDDLTQGHSLMANPACRALQQRFLVHAKAHAARLRTVLRSSADGRQRAIAAQVLGYAPEKNLVVDDLLYAIRDPEDEVRNNAMRALGAIAVLAGRRPELGIQIPPLRFVEMLNSIIWSDRNKALMVLLTLTESRDPRVLKRLHQTALPSLVEMARWKSRGHATPAYILLGRVAGLSDEEIQASLSVGDRETAISQLAKSATKKWN